jgi:general stress protein 26
MDITEPTVTEILGKAMVARIATVSKNGRPHVNPLYFVVEDGHIHLGTATFTLASHNVRANPTVQILFEIESEPDDRRVLRLDGTAVVRTDAALMKQYRRGVARKYIVTPLGLWNMLVHPRQWRPMRRHLAGGSACVLDATPTSWELCQTQLPTSHGVGEVQPHRDPDH